MYFETKVDRRSRKSMLEFLQKHYRYYTLSSINRSTSYAHCIKLRHLGLTNVQEDKAWEILTTDFWSEIEGPIDEFTRRHNGHYTIGSNGRSSGYLVLYESMYKPTGHKSWCRTCGQRNFTLATEIDQTIAEGILRAEVIRNGGCWTAETYLTQSAVQAVEMGEQEKLAIIRDAKLTAKDRSLGNRCGRCGAEGEKGRVNYTVEPKGLAVYSGRGIDEDLQGDSEEWSLAFLRERVDLVCDFDRTCDQIRDNFIALVNNCTVEEVTIMVPQKVMRLTCNCGDSAHS